MVVVFYFYNKNNVLCSLLTPIIATKTKAIKNNQLKRLLVSTNDLFSLDSITNSYRYG